MIKKFYIFLFISILLISCGKKGDPVYKEQNDSKIESHIKLNTST
tara:strand:+ start:332 stop:466 length:135 start_codon:yes stop_codon:yes gene_type:complete